MLLLCCRFSRILQQVDCMIRVRVMLPCLLGGTGNVSGIEKSVIHVFTEINNY